ncbi:hypothetical protein EYC84_003215 [Monilinia fructicola]|uniref:Uncharacterized protein n=1 Tax=Monilinia fructicola TaxID=38448 RepID=A0A5M9JVY2_MONFR|nr:hypothetical protein EYC84_003215 [Monilinia fructicola]
MLQSYPDGIVCRPGHSPGYDLLHQSWKDVTESKVGSCPFLAHNMRGENMQRRAVNLNVHAFCCGAEFKWRTSGENRILDEWEYQVDQVEGLREAELQDQEEMEVEEINWQCFEQWNIDIDHHATDGSAYINPESSPTALHQRPSVTQNPEINRPKTVSNINYQTHTHTHTQSQPPRSALSKPLNEYLFTSPINTMPSISTSAIEATQRETPSPRRSRASKCVLIIQDETAEPSPKTREGNNPSHARIYSLVGTCACMPAAPWLFRLAYFVFLILLFIHSFIRLFVGSFTYFAQVAMVIGELRCSVCGLVAWCGLLYSSIRFGAKRSEARRRKGQYNQSIIIEQIGNLYISIHLPSIQYKIQQQDRKTKHKAQNISLTLCHLHLHLHLHRCRQTPKQKSRDQTHKPTTYRAPIFPPPPKTGGEEGGGGLKKILVRCIQKISPFSAGGADGPSVHVHRLWTWDVHADADDVDAGVDARLCRLQILAVGDVGGVGTCVFIVTSTECLPPGIVFI